MEKVVKSVRHHYSASNPIYGIGIFGALYYFYLQNPTFAGFLLAFVKAIFWPAFLVFKIFTNFQI